MISLGALAGHRLVPVVQIDDPSAAPDLAHALLAGGIACAEVVLRTPAAMDAIRAMAGVPGFAVGAGTVLSRADAAAALDAGATFAVSPGFDVDLVDFVRAAGVGVLPGVASATEAQHAVKAGIDVVKFFPADRLGGLETIRALAGPFPMLGFVPSGGVTSATAVEYLSSAHVPAVSGSWMAPRDAIAARDWASISRLAAESVTAIGRA